MKDLLYFPGFEVKDQRWLKFALLYFDELRPIIPFVPYDEERYLSDTAIMVMTETDFIKPYRPNYDDGKCASIIACEEFDRYLKHPELYTPFFGRGEAFALINEKWTNPRYHTTTLFEDKYSYIFSDYCLKNKIASRCDEGINLSDELAFVYMSFLADTISKNKGWEMVTDINRYSATLRVNDIQLSKLGGQKIETIKNHIELYLPDNLHNIPIKQIVSLRKQRSFNQCRHAFLNETIKRFQAMEEGMEYPLDEYFSYQKEFLGICGRSFDMLASGTLSALSILPVVHGDLSPVTLSAAAATYNEFRAVKGAAQEMPQFLKSLRNKRQARRYVAKLNRINRKAR
ncbi:MAG: hypothetical protein VB126_01935 [Paludibacter sp.]|nr:hypothetical protein [Paludibacter sp.]